MSLWNLLLPALLCNGLFAQAPGAPPGLRSGEGATVSLLDDAAAIDFGVASDVNLYRKDAQTLKTDNDVEIGGARLSVANDAAALRLGAALDVNLYRHDAGTLKTDSSLHVGNNLLVSNELFVGTPSVSVLAAIALIYSGPAIINVGPSRVFNDIVSAYATISGKLLLAPVTIQVDAGVYSLASPLIFQQHATPHLISIRGDPAAPTNVVLQATSSAVAPAVLYFTGAGTRGMTFAGFTISMPDGVSGTCIAAYDTFVVTTTMVLRGCNYGLWAAFGATIRASGSVFARCTNGAGAMYHSYIDVGGSSFTGSSTAGTSGVSASVDSLVSYDGAAFDTVGYAVSCSSGSVMYAATASFTNVAAKTIAYACGTLCGPFGAGGASNCV